jgi:hypothetical protein
MPVSADHVIETFEAAKDENVLDRHRVAQMIRLPSDGEVWMTGDLHDHRNNFRKLIRTVDLERHPERHLILHELIHGDHYDANGAEDSWNMLFQAAELKCEYPHQVHFLFANHDLAQIHGEGIMKGGLSVCEAFNAGVARDFGGRASAVQVAITEFLLSLPLAVRCPNGIFLCHSLPPDEQIPDFDFTVFDRETPLPTDYRRKTGPIYQLIWGRKVTPAGVQQFASKVNAELIVTGHQPQESGYAVNGTQHLIIASDHNQGVFLPFKLNERYDMPSLVSRLRKFITLDA